MVSLERLNTRRPDYGRLAHEACLTRRRKVALYLHASSRMTYLCFFLCSMIACALIVANKKRLQETIPPAQTPSQQAKPIPDESRTPRGYYRRYISHQVGAGDTFDKIAKMYYSDFSDLFFQHRAKNAIPWKVIQEANPKPDATLIDPTDIPVASELRIPLP